VSRLEPSGICDECGQSHADLVFIPGPSEDQDYWICRTCQDMAEDMVELMIDEHKGVRG
jgi:hypothetical protein